MSGDDRPGGGADERLAVAQVKPGGVLDPRQHAHHPGFAENAAAAENEHVGPERMRIGGVQANP